MKYLLVINGMPVRIGTKEQMLAFIGTYLPNDTGAHVRTVHELKRTIPYWYYAESDSFGNSLFVFKANALLFAASKTIFELPVHQPQGTLL